jgi:hypothetical protein
MSVSLLQVSAMAAASGASSTPSLQMSIGYNNPLSWTQATPAPTEDGILVADISHLLPYFSQAAPPAAFPTLNLKVGNVICGYQLGKATVGDVFPSTGTLFLYLSVDNSLLNADGTVIVDCVPLSSIAELVNDVDTNTPSAFTASVFGAVLSTATSLRLMAYYSSPTTPPDWSIVLSLGAVGVQPLPTVLGTPPPPP